MIVGIGKFVTLIGNAGVENKVSLVLYQPCHMAMGQLCRITFRFAGDGFNSEFINFPGGLGGQHGTEFQSTEKYRPERIVFVQIQHSWNAHGAPDCFFFRKGLVIKNPFVFVCVQIGNLFFVFFFSKAFFTAVSGDEPAVSGKKVDG